MAKSVADVIGSLDKFLYNPAGIQSAMLNATKGVLTGDVDVVDAVNPAMMLFEANAITTAAFVSRVNRSVRQSYAYLAQTEDEIYRHMSDKDHLDRFALPSTARFAFFVNKAELLSKMVLDTNTGIRKVVIPRNSYITVSDVIFSIQYPVEIRVLNHGGLQVIYDVEAPSPIKTLESNLIDWTIVRTDDGTEMLSFSLDFTQYQIIEHSIPVNASSLIVENIPITDQYYYCRVFRDNGDDAYTEYRTTHSDSVYDPTIPTAVLMVGENKLTVKIPQVYVDSGLVDKTIKVYVYTTKGRVDIPLQSYSTDTITKSFWSIFPNELNEYVAPLSTFNQWIIQALTSTIGGADKMKLTDLVNRIKTNAMGSPELPITPAQRQASLRRLGYEVVKNIDNITNRIYLASRSMPEPTSPDLITSAAAGIGTLPSKLNQLSSLTTVKDNGTIITLLPETLYRMENGVIGIVGQTEKDMLEALPAEQRALMVTRNSYLYTPFYYMLDTSNSEFEVRAYHLDDPKIHQRTFVEENDTSGFQVSVGSIAVERQAYGYRLLVQTTSTDNWKFLDDVDTGLQLSIQPNGSSDRAYVNATLLGRTDKGERIYEVPVHVNFAVDSADRITVTNFVMFGDEPLDIQMDLNTPCELFFHTTAYPQGNWTRCQADSLLGFSILPNETYALTHEKFTLLSGLRLDNLWSRARTVVSEADYVRWDADVPATYSEDVYEVDPITGARFSIIDGQVVTTILHHAGDVILDGGGNPVIKHYAGETRNDEYGNPLIRDPRNLLRQCDLLLIEGSYLFATDNTAQEYRRELTSNLVEWITEELPKMGGNLLENTELVLYPTSSIGYVNIMFGSGMETNIEASQSFQVTFHVRADVYSNPVLRNSIERIAITTIGDALKNVKVAVSDIVKELKEKCGEDVLAISLKGLGGSRNFDVVTVLDDAKRLSIKKRLVNRSDGILYIQEAVDVEFVRHTVN